MNNFLTIPHKVIIAEERGLYCEVCNSPVSLITPAPFYCGAPLLVYTPDDLPENQVKKSNFHHKDKNQRNNDYSNIQILCTVCHWHVHHPTQEDLREVMEK